VFISCYTVIVNFSNINTNLYRTFIEVYETKSFSKAAENLFCTQPAVGSAIRELEAQLKTKLFVTHTRGVEPTSAASELYRVVQPAFVELNRGEDVVREISALTAGEISLSCPSHISCFVLLKYICDFRKQYPNIRIKIYTVGKNETIEMLSKRNIEFAIEVLPLENSSFDVVSLLEMPYTFYTSKKFLAENNLNEIIKKNDLEKHPIIVPAKTSRTLQTLIKKLNVDVNVMIEATTSELGYNLVLNDCGIGHTLEIFLDGNYRKDEIVKLKLKDAELPKATLAYACYEKSVSKAGQVFLKGLREYCEKLGNNNE